MRTTLIINPNSGSAGDGSVLQEALGPMAGIELLETRQAGDARRLAREAVAGGAELLVAAGGDGTINEVLNGLAEADFKAVLGVIPLGTGNDLARTLALPADPVEAFGLLTAGTPRSLDVIEIDLPGGKRHFALNVSAGGFSGQLNEILTDELKAAWGPLAYMRGALAALPDLTEYRTTVQYDGEEAERIDALNIIIANARTAAAGVQVAPLANPEDGLLDVVIVHAGSLAALAGAAARLLVNGNYLNSDAVTHRKVRNVRVESQPGMWFNADGELLSNEPMEFRVRAGALQVIVGPGYQAEPPAAPVDAPEGGTQ
ncbi:MAG TPA: diacylglycerol kinase family protein [Herpetosiphonaceae bacterium]